MDSHFSITSIKGLRGLKHKSFVRFLGRITQFEPENDLIRATWEDATIMISIVSLRNDAFYVDHLYDWMCVLETENDEKPQVPFVRAMLAWKVDDLELDLLSQTEALKRAFLASDPD